MFITVQIRDVTCCIILSWWVCQLDCPHHLLLGIISCEYTDKGETLVLVELFSSWYYYNKEHSIQGGLHLILVAARFKPHISEGYYNTSVS